LVHRTELIAMFLHRISHYKEQISYQKLWVSRLYGDNCMVIPVVFRKSV